MVLSDDDVLDPLCFQEHLADFELDKDHRANYHGYNIVYLGSNLPEKTIMRRKIFNLRHVPKISFDGGAMMFEKSLRH